MFSRRFSARKTKVHSSVAPCGTINLIISIGFVNMLNEMRFGEMSESTVKIFGGLDRLVNYEDGVQPTELYDGTDIRF